MAHDLHDGVTVEDTTIAGFPATVARPQRPENGTGPHQEKGSGPVVFLHGAFADHVGFEGWLRRFADAGFPAIAASRRGRLGVGPERAAGQRFSSYVADTAAVLDTLGEPPVLVGHSLGGLAWSARPPALRRRAPPVPRARPLDHPGTWMAGRGGRHPELAGRLGAGTASVIEARSGQARPGDHGPVLPAA